MPQQTLGCHHHQWLSPDPQDLPAKTMKQLRRSRWLHDLNIVLCRQQEKPLKPGAGMLGPHALKAMRKKHDDARKPIPLILRTDDELIDNHLGNVDKVAELGLPHHQAIWAVQTVAILKAEHARL